MMSHIAVHAGNRYAPLQAPRDSIGRFSHIPDVRRRTFAGKQIVRKFLFDYGTTKYTTAMVHRLDESVGEIVEALERKGLLSNSIIVFTTDYGGATAGRDGSVGSNFPLRGVSVHI